ncbi:Fc.00g072860.m01.CDS01 [Cosmosporella sp. VM-42]
MPPGRLDGKVAVITGVASGFGKGIATTLHQVVVAELSEEAGNATAQDLSCFFRRADVTKKVDWEELLAEALKTCGSLDIIVNNAGDGLFTDGNTESSSALSQPLDPLVLEPHIYSPVYTTGNTSLEEGSAISGSITSGGGQLDFRGSGFDWLDFEEPDVELAINLAGFGMNIPALNPMMPVLPAAESISPPLPVHQPRQSTLPWPLEQGKDMPYARYPPPPLPDVLQNSQKASPGARMAAIEGLVQILS